jgi:2'-5' RNA ligase
MTHYHIEFRIRGYAKRYARDLIYNVAKRFKVRGVIRGGKAVPHISLYGPFNTNQQRQMVNEVVKVCSQYKLVPFTFNGFNYFDNSKNKVVYLDIEPSQALIDLRYDISRALLPITHSKSQEDKKGKSDFKFHSTIAFKDIDRKFNDIWHYIDDKERPHIKQHLLRVTIIRNSKILYEYDLIQQRLLNRTQALNKRLFALTINRLKSEKTQKDAYTSTKNSKVETNTYETSHKNTSFLTRLKEKLGW